MWLKYDSKPIDLGSYTDRTQTEPKEDGYRSCYEKPRGCWITDDTEECWRSWCMAENFGPERLTHKHSVTLDESKILILRSPFEIDDFTADFGTDVWWGPDGHPRKYRDRCVAWEKVAATYDGLIVTPYIWERRMSDDSRWYYTWDCASGCIWNVRAIKSIDLIEVTPVPERAEAA